MKNKKIKFAAICFILIFIAVCSMADEPFKNSIHTVTANTISSDFSGRYLSVKDKSVTQKIKLEGSLRDFEFYFVIANGANYESAAVLFQAEQGKIRNTFEIQAKELANGYCGMKQLVSNLGEGEAKLTVTGSHFPENTDLFLLLSDESETGLEPAVFDGNVMDGPIVLKYTILRTDGYLFYSLFFGVLLLGIILLLAYEFAFHQDTLCKKEKLYFLSFLLLFLYISLRNPLASFFAEPHSEMAYEFWYKAHNLGFVNNLMSLMSGECLVWTERLLMYLADRLVCRKYVFVAAQIFQLCIICAFSSLFTLSYFRRYFCDEIRLIVSFFCGALLLFPSAYYFWAVSYWACFFLIPVLFMDLERLKRPVFGILLCMTTVLVVSRIYHIVFIPIAIILLLTVGKTKGKRFQLFVLDILASALFETIYSMIYGGQNHLDGVFRLILYSKNTLYYQIQVLISIFIGENVKNAFLANIVFFGVFLGIVLFFICMVRKRRNGYACAVGCSGMLSIGTIAINVTVCGMSDSVGFPYDYAKEVHWNECYYQQGDLHFSYAYLACIVIFLVISFYFIETMRSQNKVWITVVSAGMILFVLHYGIVNQYKTYPMEMIPTDWKHTAYVTDNEKYYLPINVSYPFADISLKSGSTGYIYGIDEAGELFFWNEDKRYYGADTAIHTAKIGEVSDIENRKVLMITLRKYHTNFSVPYTLALYDRQGNKLMQVDQTNDVRRIWMDFILDEPLQNVYSFSVYDVEGNDASICDGIQIGVEDE